MTVFKFQIRLIGEIFPNTFFKRVEVCHFVLNFSYFFLDNIHLDKYVILRNRVENYRGEGRRERGVAREG